MCQTMSEMCQTVTEVVYYNNLIHNIFCKCTYMSNDVRNMSNSYRSSLVDILYFLQMLNKVSDNVRNVSNSYRSSLL